MCAPQNGYLPDKLTRHESAAVLMHCFYDCEPVIVDLKTCEPLS